MDTGGSLCRPSPTPTAVGAALLRHAEIFARETEAVRVSLATAHANVTAQRLYVACGYTLDEVFRTYSLQLSAPAR